MKGLGVVVILSMILTCGGCGGEPPKSTKGPVPPVGKQPATSAKTPPPLNVEVKVEPPPLVTYVYDPNLDFDRDLGVKFSGHLGNGSKEEKF